LHRPWPDVFPQGPGISRRNLRLLHFVAIPYCRFTPALPGDRIRKTSAFVRSIFMFKSRSILMLAALMASSAAAIAATPAEARERGRVVIANGPYGGGYVAGRHVSRQPGSTKVTRGVLTRSGHGYRQTRSTTRGDGTISNTVQRRYANGASMSRSGTAVRNPDGSVS